MALNGAERSTAEKVTRSDSASCRASIAARAAAASGSAAAPASGNGRPMFQYQVWPVSRLVTPALKIPGLARATSAGKPSLRRLTSSGGDRRPAIRGLRPQAASAAPALTARARRLTVMDWPGTLEAGCGADATGPMRSRAPMKAPAVILVEPQLAENIGAVARVMGNFGLEDLRLVRPRDGWPQARAWASASGADWPLEGARVFPSLEEAIADLRLVLATTARPRETQLPVETPREAAGRLIEAAGRGWASGLVFGGERAGLETADIALCHSIVTAPVDARFRSLNLAQSVAICAYEWRVRVAPGPPPGF